MADTDQNPAPFIFIIPSPRVRTAIALAFVTIWLLLLSILPVRVGMATLLQDIWDEPLLWAASAMLLLPIGFFLWLAFPPRGLLASLHFTDHKISFIPDPMTRRLFGEQDSEAAITPRTTEILLCRTVPIELGGGYGYKVIVRETDGSEHGVKAGWLTFHSVRENQKISEGISAATGLSVRNIIRLRLANGTVLETPWEPSSANAILRTASAFFIAALPICGGISVGFIMPPPAAILAVGMALWVFGSLLTLTRTKRNAGGSFMLNSLLNLFLFGATYGALVLIVGNMFHGH